MLDKPEQTSFTNTATGERIRAQEANSRYQLKIDNLDGAIAELGKIMLIVASSFAEENIVIRRFQEGEMGFVDINAELFKKATKLNPNNTYRC